MGISINVNTKQDYSYLFQNMSSSSSLGNLNFLSDYASIKNGSYAKLMKAYYAKNTSSTDSSSSSTSTKSSISTASDSTKVLSNIEKAAEGMKDSADKLLEKGSDSLFEKGDVDATYQAVSTFADSYNKLLDRLDLSSTKSLQSRMSALTDLTTANSKKLAEIGITVNADDTLSVDENTFKAADQSKVKSLFGTNGSYGYQVSAQASLADYTAEKESTKANTYNQSGSYSYNYSVGSLLNAMF